MKLTYKRLQNIEIHERHQETGAFLCTKIREQGIIRIENEARIAGGKAMAIKTIEILNVMVFKRHLRKNNAAFNSVEEGDSFNDGFKLKFCDGINVLIGENGVGKTTILKMLYAATQWSIKQTDQGKTKRFVQFFSNSLKDSDALKNAVNKEDYCYYKVSDGTHSFEDSLSHKSFFN